MPEGRVVGGSAFRETREMIKGRTSECESELEERDSGAPTCAETLVHDLDVRASAAQLCVEHDEAYRPICDSAEHYQEYDTGHETRLPYGVR